MAVKEKIVITADDKTARAFRSVQKSAKRTGADLAAMSRKMAGVALVGAAAAAGLFLLTKRAIENADAIGKTADAIGISVEALQDYRHAAELSGIETAKFDNSLIQFSKRVGEASAGTGSLIEFLNKYDKSLIPAITSTNNAGEALDAVFDIMADMTSQTDKAAFAAAAFGRSGVVMTNMLRDGKVGLKEMREEAHRLGLVLDEETVRGAEAANDELLRMQKIISVNLQKALLDILPTLEGVTEGIATLTRNIKLALAVFKDAADLDMTEAAHQVDLARESVDRFQKSIDILQAFKDKHGALTPMQTLDLIEMNSQLTKSLVTLGAWEARLAKLRKDAETGGSLTDVISGGGAADDITIDKTIENERKRAEALLLAIEETNMQIMGHEAELIDMRAEAELVKLAELHEKKLISEMEFLEATGAVMMTALMRKQELEAETEAAITANQKAEFDKREEAARALADAELRARRGLHDGLSAIASLMNVQNRKAFEIGKAGAASLALVKTYEGAQSVFASAAMMGPAGWILAPIAAAAAVVSGLANVQAILSTSYGGGGGGRGGGGGGVSMPSVPAPDVPALAPPANDQGPTRVLDVTLVGSAFTAESIRDELFPLMNEALGDGVQLNVTVTV